MNLWSGKKVLIAGGTGLVGIPLTRLLIKSGARVKVVAISNPYNFRDCEVEIKDLTDYQNCLRITNGMDYVFNLMCLKGSPKAMADHPAKFFDALIPLSTCLGRASLSNQVGGYLFTSSVGVYQPAEILFEDDVWKTMPSKNDWYAGWAKRMGELQVEAYRLEHNWKNTAIVRPSNIYGPYDDFRPESAMFMASKIMQFARKGNPIIVWGDGSQVRDFIFSEDAAKGILLAAEKGAGPVNLCSGRPTTVKEVVEIIAKISGYNPEIIFDKTKPLGDKKRLLDTSLLKSIGFEPATTLEDGIEETIRWYTENHR